MGEFFYVLFPAIAVGVLLGMAIRRWGRKRGFLWAQPWDVMTTPRPGLQARAGRRWRYFAISAGLSIAGFGLVYFALGKPEKLGWLALAYFAGWIILFLGFYAWFRHIVKTRGAAGPPR